MKIIGCSLLSGRGLTKWVNGVGPLESGTETRRTRVFRLARMLVSMATLPR